MDIDSCEDDGGTVWAKRKSGLPHSVLMDSLWELSKFCRYLASPLIAFGIMCPHPAPSCLSVGPLMKALGMSTASVKVKKELLNG